MAEDNRLTYVKQQINEVTSMFKSNLNNISKETAQQVSDVVGPELTKVFSIFKNTLASTVEYSKSFFKGAGVLFFGAERRDKEESKSDKKRNSLLQNIVDYFKKEEKREAREGDNNSITKMFKSFFSRIAGIITNFLLSPLVFFGTVIGGYIISWSKSFVIISNFLKKIPSFLKNLLKSPIKFFKEYFPGYDKLEKIVIKTWKPIQNFVKKDNIITKTLLQLEIWGEEFLIFFKKFSIKFDTIIKGDSILTNIFKFSKNLQKITGFIGAIIGKVLFPLEMIIKALWGFFKAEGIRNKILAASAGILDPVLGMFEFIGNILLWVSRKVFGKDFLKDFKFNFSAKWIIEKVNQFTSSIMKPFIWIMDNILGEKNFIKIYKAFDSLFSLDTLINTFKHPIDTFISFWSNTFNIITSILKFQIDNISNGIKEWINKKIEPLKNTISDIIMILIHKIISFVFKISSFIPGAKKSLEKMGISKPLSDTEMENLLKMRKSEAQKKEEELKKERYETMENNKKLAEAVNKGTERSVNQSNQIVNAINNTNVRQERPIPSQNENGILATELAGG